MKRTLYAAALSLMCQSLIVQSATAESAAMPSVPQSAVILTDTGITSSQCYQAGATVFAHCQSADAQALSAMQDGMTGRDADSASNNDADGKLGFSYQRLEGGCVLDKITGLTWELKDTAGGLRDKARVFTNLGKNQAGDVTELITEANHQKWCGYDDWRLPTIDELQSLINYGTAPPELMIGSAWFPDAQGRAYWSSTPYVGYGNKKLGYVWVLYFNDGEMTDYGRYLSLLARLVRGGVPAPNERYLISADGEEVTDTVTDLIWRRCVEGASWNKKTCTPAPYHSYTQEAAFTLAKAASVSSKKNWRVPNVKELSSIMQRNRNPAFDPQLFPATPIDDWLWTSTPAIGRPAAENQFNNEVRQVWYGAFENGATVRYDRNTHSVRLVRTREK